MSIATPTPIPAKQDQRLKAPLERPAGQARVPAVAPGDSALLACLQCFLSELDWTAGSAAVATWLNNILGCHRVSLGWVSGHALRLRVLSDGVLLDEGVAIPELHQAMLEATQQRVVLVWPGPTDDSGPAANRVTLAHQTLSRVQGLSGLVTVPLVVGDTVWGALTCERTSRHDPLSPISTEQGDAAVGFTQAEIQWLGALAALLTPAMALRYKLEQPGYERLHHWIETLSARLSDPRERVLRWSVLAFFGVTSFGIGLPLPYQLTVKARLEGTAQRIMSAPQVGRLRQVHVRPGDVVKAGQVLAEMDDEEWQGARRARIAELAQHEHAAAQALVRGDHARAEVAQAQAQQVKAQLSLLEQQLAGLKITSPFDGVVIAGDLRQQLGALIQRGDSLLTLAPGLDWRVVMDVDESDVAALNKGQSAQLRLASMPDQTIGLVLRQVMPVAHRTSSGLKYELEALASGAGAGARGLRPGLQGVVRIDMPAKPILWRLTDRCWQWLRMLAWTWL